MILQATKRHKLKATILVSILVFTAVFNLFFLNKFDLDTVDFFDGFVIGICLVFIAVWFAMLISTALKKLRKEDRDNKDLSLSKQYLSIGMLSLVIGSIIQRVNIHGEWVHVVAEILYISSIIFNIAYVIKFRKIKID